ncbi:MAG: aspartate/glutamate racemase family protein [Nitrospiraceae bacterium]
MDDHRNAAIQHIGIVAGTAEGAALCYRTICREAGKLLGPHVHPEVTMHTFPLHLYLDAIQQDDWRTVAMLMSQSAEKLAFAGADFIICPNNTLHQAFDLTNSPIPWLHIADVAATESARRGFHRVGLLGTRIVMEGSLYPRRLGRLGIDYAIPDEHERARLQDMILNELVAGEIRKESRSYVSVLVERLYKRGCDAVILACTELPLLITSDESVVPLLDSTGLLAKAALTRAFAERDNPTAKTVLYGHA